MSNFRVVQHPTAERKKRKPSCFMLFRQEMMKVRPRNITMVKYSKQVSKMWHNLPQNKKNYWKKLYEIYRDCSSNNTNSLSVEAIEVLQSSPYSYDGAKIFINEVEDYVKPPEFLFEVLQSSPQSSFDNIP